jgi:small conductance mechanosensitive channel
MKDEIMTMQTVVNTIVDFFVNYSFQIVGAFIVLILGVIVGRGAASFLLKIFERKGVDITFSKFVAAGVKGVILGFAMIVALGKFGITIAPLVAALAAMAFGASFAIQGPLSNYGAGLVIIITRPFVVGNTIQVAGVSGVVEEVKLGATTLTDEDGVNITIPNKHIVGEILHNSQERKIVEEIVRIRYGDDAEGAIETIKKTLEGFDEVSREAPPQVGIQRFGESSIHIGLRYWIPTRKYFHTLYTVNLALHRKLKEEHIDIPFPRRDVRILPGTPGDLPTTSVS